MKTSLQHQIASSHNNISRSVGTASVNNSGVLSIDSEQFSFDTCSIDGCLSDTAYALIDPKTKRVHRISFSTSLLKYIRNTYPQYSHLEVRTIKFRLGRELQPGEASSTGIYAIVKAKNNWTLRISLQKDIANYLCDFNSRKLRECIITKII